MAGRSVKNTPPTLRGTGRAKANTDCGSFFNKGDNNVCPYAGDIFTLKKCYSARIV
jgi:hypothetical protein